MWPHDNAPVREADTANITAYLLSETGNDSVPCNWEPVVRLWQALNTEPARPIAVGRKRMWATSGRTFPVWDFNDVDVKAARDPANKLTFFVTVDGVTTLRNVWTHAADARTILPQQDLPTGIASGLASAVDARIEIVWPHDNLPVDQATRANITAYLFEAGTKLALPPSLLPAPSGNPAGTWPPVVRLHWSLNVEADKGDASMLIGTPRIVATSSGVQFLAWDFNDVDISAARDPLNRISFWVSVDGVASFPAIWTHGADARSLVPQVDMPNACRS